MGVQITHRIKNGSLIHSPTGTHTKVLNILTLMEVIGLSRDYVNQLIVQQPFVESG